MLGRLIRALAGLLSGTPEAASARSEPPPLSCKGEAILAAAGKAPGTEGLYFPVPSISRTVAFTVAGADVTLTIGRHQVRYARRPGDGASIARIVNQVGDLSSEDRAIWLDGLTTAEGIVAANSAEMLLAFRKPGGGWTGLMLKDGEPAAFLAVRCE
jgi:hypothetical protein